MRQEPKSSNLHWLVIGFGRLGRTLFRELLNKNQIVEKLTSVNSAADFVAALERADRVLVCVPDSKIPSILDKKSRAEQVWIHFSATVDDTRAFRLHPMRSFDGREIQSAEFARIPFAKDKGTPPFEELLPGFRNPHFELNAAEFQRYHALCVLAASYPVLIWSLIENEMTSFGIDAQYLRKYALAVGQNFEKLGADALTGPWIRQDSTTIDRNIDALIESRSPLLNFYCEGLKAFGDLFFNSKKERSLDVVP